MKRYIRIRMKEALDSVPEIAQYNQGQDLIRAKEDKRQADLKLQKAIIESTK